MTLMISQLLRKFFIASIIFFTPYVIQSTPGDRWRSRFIPFAELTPDALAYCPAGATIYDQKDILETSEYKEASLSERKDLLEKHLYKNQLNAYIRRLKNQGINASPYFLLAATLYYLRDRLPRIPNFAGFGAALALQDYLGSAAERSLDTANLVLSLLKKRYISEESLNFFDKSEIEYARNKQDIPEIYQKVFERVFFEKRCRPQWDEEHYTKMLLLAKNLPLKNKEIVYDSETIDKLFAGYDQESQGNLKRYCIRHVAACRENNVRKIAAYFWGKPGVGKTRAAHVIAQGLDLPIKKISLADITIDKLIGTEEEPGLLLSMLCENADQQANPKNMILLIDDADRVLLAENKHGLYSFLLTLLEPETKSFYSPFLGVEVDISSLGIVLAGNSDITEPALRSRLHIINFKDHTNEYKKKVVWDELFPSMLATHKKAKLQLTEQDFTQDDRDAINNFIENDEDPGFRSIKLKLTQYIEDKVLSKHFPNNAQEETPAQAA